MSNESDLTKATRAVVEQSASASAAQPGGRYQPRHRASGTVLPRVRLLVGRLGHGSPVGKAASLAFAFGVVTLLLLKVIL